MEGMDEPCGADRSMISLFFPEYFLVATPMGLMRWEGKGGGIEGTYHKPLLDLLLEEGGDDFWFR